MVLTALAGVEKPISGREIAERILQLQGLDANDRAQLKAMTHRVCVSLWVQNQKGLVRKIEAGRSRYRWELARR